jgi:hypothetical protein
MKFLMTKVLWFWVDVECERVKNQVSDPPEPNS